MVQPIPPSDIADAVAALEHWRYDPERRAIHRSLVFPGFVQALAAMVEIGFAAERANHHPEWFNVYDRLDIWLTTHDADGLSEKDLDLARSVDRLVAGRLATA
ncbi:4a-hydroxytetrahydrobiopterin dehydratase [Brevundimonas diminuta]|uniref:4a-hydroxytetrahydrobiopterin dehydratase n=1 Tax=Brevundimonas diminuta TaxID=293 RepID=UPI0037C92205